MPYRWIKFEFKPDTAGAGKWRGGLGTARRSAQRL